MQEQIHELVQEGKIDNSPDLAPGYPLRQNWTVGQLVTLQILYICPINKIKQINSQNPLSK